MKIGILCAGDGEVAPVLSRMTDIKPTDRIKLRFYEGKLDGHDVVTLFSGVCKVNAGVATQVLIDGFGCDAVINCGTCGGIDENVDLFHTVIGMKSFYHDVNEENFTDFHPWLSEPAFPSDEGLIRAARAVEKSGKAENLHFGLIVSGERFIVHDERQKIIEKFHPLAVDMETAAAAHTCYVNDIPFLAVRTVTDTGKHPGLDEFEANCDRASDIAAEVTRMIIGEYMLHNTLTM